MDASVPLLNQYVGSGDMVAATPVAAMMGRRTKPIRLRRAGNVEFADLRRRETLLIGAVTNRWTMELGQNWRFRFIAAAGQRFAIVDTALSREWGVPYRADDGADSDYMLICRVQEPQSGGFFIVAAGVKHAGTGAAGRLLTQPAQLGAVLRHLPPSWEQKNLKIVLRSKVIGNTPAQPELVAWHVW